MGAIGKGGCVEPSVAGTGMLAACAAAHALAHARSICPLPPCVQASAGWSGSRVNLIASAAGTAMFSARASEPPRL